MRASLKATFGSTWTGPRSVPNGFRPAVVRLAADAPPMRLEFQVAGLERVYFATLGRYPEHGSAMFLSPRLLDNQGACVEWNWVARPSPARRAGQAVTASCRSTARRSGASRSRWAKSASSSTGNTSDWRWTSATSRRSGCPLRGRRLPADLRPRSGVSQNPGSAVGPRGSRFPRSAIADRDGDGAARRDLERVPADLGRRLRTYYLARPASDWNWPARRSNSSTRPCPGRDLAAELDALADRVGRYALRTEIRLPRRPESSSPGRWTCGDGSSSRTPRSISTGCC